MSSSTHDDVRHAKCCENMDARGAASSDMRVLAAMRGAARSSAYGQQKRQEKSAKSV